MFSLKTKLCILKCLIGFPDCLQRCWWTRTPRPALVSRQVALFATVQGQLGNTQVSREAASITSWYRSCQLYLPLSLASEDVPVLKQREKTFSFVARLCRTKSKEFVRSSRISGDQLLSQESNDTPVVGLVWGRIEY